MELTPPMESISISDIYGPETANLIGRVLANPEFAFLRRPPYHISKTLSLLLDAMERVVEGYNIMQFRRLYREDIDEQLAMSVLRALQRPRARC